MFRRYVSGIIGYGIDRHSKSNKLGGGAPARVEWQRGGSFLSDVFLVSPSLWLSFLPGEIGDGKDTMRYEA